MPTPYALSSDLVSAWPAKSLEVATYLDTALAAKTDLAMTQNAQTGTSYSYVLLDAAKLLTMNNAASNTVLVTKQATVTWVTGTQLRVINLGVGVTTLVADTGVTINNNRTLAQYQGGTLIRTASDVWLFVPNAGIPANSTATVASGQATTSATYTDLATVGPAVTLVTGSKALVIVSATMYNSTAGKGSFMSFAVSGATTVAASDNWALTLYASPAGTFLNNFTLAYTITGLTIGSNTFTAKYRSDSAGTANFDRRQITVIDLGS